MLGMLADIEINEDNITEEDLADVDLLIITKPDATEANFTEEEIAVIQDYLENESGSIFLMGEWYRYFETGNFNNITQKYGIIWYDADVFNDVSNDGVNYHPYITRWPNNYITRNMSIIGQVTQVVFSGTALNITSPEDPALIEHGPYPIGVGDDDTYVKFENGTSVTSGNNTVVFAAVELIGGGKIFASGSTWMFAYDNVYSEDNLALLLLIAAWLLGISPDEVLIPIIREFTSDVTGFAPQDTSNVIVTVDNLANADKENVSLRIDLPYFLEVVGNMTITRGTGTEEIPYVPGEAIDLGTVTAKETITIEFQVKCVLGIETSITAYARLYMGAKEIFYKALPMKAFPAFYVEVEFSEFPLNVSKTNTTTMSITVYQNASFPMWSVNVEINSTTEGVYFSEESYTIALLGIGGNHTEQIEVTVSGTGVYSLMIRVTHSEGGEAIIRPTLVASDKPIILFDNAHYQYWAFGPEGMTGLIDLLSQYAPVAILKDKVKADLLAPSVTALYVIPNPEPASESPSDKTSDIFSDEELLIIQNYIETGGSVLMTGNYYTYFWPDNPNGYNDLTEKYGLSWIDGDVYDDENYIQSTWHVKAMRFADNWIANVMKVGIEYVEYAGTAILLGEPDNSVTAELYPILIGNNSSYVTEGAPDAEKVAEGENVTMIAAAIINNKGKILASGSSYVFSSNYYFDANKRFIENMLAWLLGVKSLNLDIFNAPFEINVGKEFYITVTVSNGGFETLTDLQLTITTTSGLTLLNETGTIDIGTLEPGALESYVFVFKADTAGTYTVTITVTASNYEAPVTKSFIVTYKTPQFAIPLEYILAIIIVPIILAPIAYIYIKSKKAAQ